MLLDAGHRVTGTTRSAKRREWLRGAGADVATVDVYDADALRAAVDHARPDVVIHQLTVLARGFGPPDLARNRLLREVGTRHLATRHLLPELAGWWPRVAPGSTREDRPLPWPSSGGLPAHTTSSTMAAR